jgi:hypothetical protein
MRLSHRRPTEDSHVLARIVCATVVICGLVLLAIAAPALAAYEQVATFGGTPGVFEPRGFDWPEEVQLGGVGGMAVNYTGAGGVPAGTIYAVAGEAAPEEANHVARYNPNGSFSEAWSWAGNPANFRCGPEGAPSEPTCKSADEKLPSDVDVDVDQATGYVYVLTESTIAGTKLVHVYSADGSRVIAEFGELAASGESIAESPGKLHENSYPSSLAVNAAGDVYIFDASGLSLPGYTHRIMEFVPQSPGDFEHYVYAGQAHDFAVGHTFPPTTYPVTDDAGHVYVGFYEDIEEYDPSSPGASPLCKFTLASGGITSLTVNPQTGEVFFYDYKDKQIHRLLGCAEGKFVEDGTIALSPSTQEEAISGLAFDPVRQFGPGRPPGVLYAADAGPAGALNGSPESSLGYMFTRSAELAPTVESESVAHVTSGSAVLGADINPEGAVTRYVFQYETQAAFEANEGGEPFAGATELPLGGAVSGETQSIVAVSASLTALEPDTSYRYRVLASSKCAVAEPQKPCEALGESASFHTYQSSVAGVLPDDRVYELVSPPQKNGATVFPADPTIASCGVGCKPGDGSGHFAQVSSVDGEAVAYRGGPFSGDEGGVRTDEYVAHRNANAGWQTSDGTPSLLGNAKGSGGYKAFNADFTLSLIEQEGEAGEPVLGGEAPAGYSNLYLQPTDDPGDLTPLVASVPPNRSGTEFVVKFAGASTDLSHVFFEANDALTEEAPGVAPAAVDGGVGKKNLYEWSEGRLSLVNVMPGNTVTRPGASFGTLDAHVISNDGTRAFFSDESGQVYVRENGQTTRMIEAAGVPDPGGFVAAAADGSAVLLANGHLHDLSDESMVDLTQGEGGFEGLVGQSEDLSHVYFVDTQVLTGKEENENCTEVRGEKKCEAASVGANNLYAWTREGGTRYIASLAKQDEHEEVEDWSPVPARRTAQASSNGRFLSFMSVASLTGYQNTGPCEPVNNGSVVVTYRDVLCPEVFLYDSATGKLRCPSCNRSGASPLGWSVLRRIQGSANLPLPHYLTDEGRLFFDSRDSLVAADTNAGVEDVYEYEPDALGDCQRIEGCVSLISSGTSSQDSNFLAADGNGSNVFFTTYDQLSPRDTDGTLDLYDARVDGGLAIETATLPSECHGETCQPPVAVPALTAPASLSFEGSGNTQQVTSPKTVKKKTVHKKPKRKRGKKARGKGKSKVRANAKHSKYVKRNRGRSQ